MRSQSEAMSFGARWRAARPGCGCGRKACAGCALTPRTVAVLQAELAWIVDVAVEDIPALRSGRRMLEQTVFADLPATASDWATSRPLWLERFRHCARRYVNRLGQPGSVVPRSLAEEVALHMAFAAARNETDPDGLLPPDMAEALPALPGDYAWVRAEEAVARSEHVTRLYKGGAAEMPPPGDPLHPNSWFDVLIV